VQAEESESAKETVSDVRRRQVFYIPGYDPMLPRRYRELYRTEGQKQAGISGYELTLKGKTGRLADYSWSVAAHIDGVDVYSDVTFLLWSDIVRASMERSIPGTFVLLLRTVWAYISTGVLWRLMRLQKGPVVAALYPILMLLGQLALSVLAGWLVYWLLANFIHWSVGLVAGAAVLAALMIWFKKKDGRFYAYYLLHDYAFSAQYGGANPPELLARMAEFTDKIHTALTSDVDEVLVVGHSSGAHLAVSVLADLIRRHGVQPDGPALGFLSLGQVVPMVSFLPKAGRLRGDLHFLSQRDELAWIDVTAPGDGCTFALCDPVMVSGAGPAPGETKRWPLVFSAAFRQSLSRELLASMKWRFFRLHFQYLCAFDRPRDYDYFLITAGPQTLAERFDGRPPSPSRIETPVSPYQDMEQG
jgi:hypothetical protein